MQGNAKTMKKQNRISNDFLFEKRHNVGGISGYVQNSTLTNCHNFGFQSAPSAVILSCADGSSCGGIFGYAVRTNYVYFFLKKYIKTKDNSFLVKKQ